MEAISANVKRLESILLTIRSKRTEIKSADLFGTWSDELTNFFEALFTSIDEDIVSFLGIITDVDHPIMKEVRKELLDKLIEKVNNNLDDTIYMIDLIINTPCKRSALHEFVSYVLRDLKLSEKIHYYICTSDSLATLPLITHFISIFHQMTYFARTQEFLLESKRQLEDFFILLIPAIVLQKKEYWSAIVHELGHVVTEHFAIIENFYTWMPLDQLDSPAGQDYYHSREYASDYIANAYAGPVFFDIQYELLYTASIRLHSTHPPWDARIYFLQTVLPEINYGRTKVTDMPKNAHISIKSLPNIIGTINSKFDQDFLYTRNDHESAIVVTNLKKGIPYIGSPRILLNAYWQNKYTIIDFIVSERKKLELPSDPLLVERGIGDIIEDSIRLANMQRTYELMKTLRK